MLRNYRRLFAAAATVAVAGTIAVTGITAASAAPRTSPAIAVTEHFQLVRTNPGSSTAPVIAYGVFTGAAVDHQGNSVDRFVSVTALSRSGTRRATARRASTRRPA
jgi:hypothetical protein